jgi:hypothetical protein
VENMELEAIKKMEKEHYDKCLSAKYYHSNKAKQAGKQIEALKKQYLQDNPNDYLTLGATVFQQQWNSVDEICQEDKNIYMLVGNGKCLEDKGLYHEAIPVYEEANKRFFKLHGDELKKIEEEIHHKLSEQVPEKRLRICKNKLFKQECQKLEKQAKELEKTNPIEAIKVYEQLNQLKPGLKKYNKRIQICENKLKKINK